MQKAEYEKVYPCSCHGEGVLVQRFKDYKTGELEPEVYLAFWGYKGGMATMRARLKYCWTMLRYGYSADEVILTKEVASALGEELQK